MTIRTFKEAWEYHMKNFAVYCLSLIAALSINAAVVNSRYYRKYNKWLVALTIVIVSITVISIITYLDPSDKDENDPNIKIGK